MLLISIASGGTVVETSECQNYIQLKLKLILAEIESHVGAHYQCLGEILRSLYIIYVYL